MRILLSLLMLCALTVRADFLHSLPDESAILPGYADADSVEMHLATLPLSPIEGIWQMAAEGAVFAIERAVDSSDVVPAELRIIMVRSPRRSVRPGTVVRHAVTTAKPGVYEARLYTSFAPKSRLIQAKSFTLGLNGDMLVFTPFKAPFKVNLFRLLPYMYRHVITPQGSRPEGLNGATRIFPRNSANQLSPIYL